METQEITFSLKIPIELNEKILRKAEAERRSRQSQIVFSLEQLFADAGNGNGKKEKTK